jgi:hypothetical protein
MHDRNNWNPQLGQRRLAMGGNGDGSGRFGCGIALPPTIVSQSPTPVRRASAGDALTGRFIGAFVCLLSDSASDYRSALMFNFLSAFVCLLTQAAYHF